MQDFIYLVCVKGLMSKWIGSFSAIKFHKNGGASLARITIVSQITPQALPRNIALPLKKTS